MLDSVHPHHLVEALVEGALYPTLAHNGFFPEEELETFMQPLARLNGHPPRHTVPGVEASTGPLGHGLPIAVGAALASRLDRASWRVFVLTGDGELSMPGVTVPGLGTLILYDGTFEIPFKDGKMIQWLEEHTQLKVAGMTVKMDELRFVTGGLRVTGSIAVPQFGPHASKIYAAATVEATCAVDATGAVGAARFACFATSAATWSARASKLVKS